MDRKRRIYGRLLMLVSISAAHAMCLCSCTAEQQEKERTEISVHFENSGFLTKADAPDEDLIKDISLIIFNPHGEAEECIWMEGGNLSSCKVKLLRDVRYTFCACANFGRRIYADHIDELSELTCHLAYPDEYKEGIPMYAMEDITVDDDTEISLSLTRLMAKISLKMDRTRLSEDVTMMVRSARIGNCPKRMQVFSPSKVRNADDCFPVGFRHDEFGAADLNTNAGNGISREISLYMLENMQGRLDEDIFHDSGKVFDKNDLRRETCSYVELEIEYQSDSRYSADKCLIYRFYLGEDRNSLDVERNCHYHITVSPEDDGLSEDSWRVDKSGIADRTNPYFASYPSSYIRGDIGDKIHIWCEFSPSDTPFDVGTEYMEDDKAEGIYDYEIDEDGRGAVLTLTGPGRGLIYMEAGDPINDAALYIIEVNLP
jgi:hypothetical protein